GRAPALTKRNVTREVTPAVRDEPEVSLEASLRPRGLSDDEYINQEKVKANLRILIDAAKARKEPLEHVALFGPPGVGKTSLANVIAHELGVPIRVTSGPAIERQADLAAILTSLAQGEVLFIDEIHRLPRIVEEVLYPAMEEFHLDIVIGKGPGARTLRLPLPRFTLVGATTPPGRLSSPLRDRFGATYRLDLFGAAPTEDAETIEDVYEPYLLREGFLMRTRRGRVATERAYRLLGRTPPTASATLWEEAQSTEA